MHRFGLVLLATIAMVVSDGRTAVAQGTFVEVGESSGVSGFTMADGMGVGVAAADFDGDGDIDLFVPTEAGEAHRLYRNTSSPGGPIQFLEDAQSVGLASLERGRSAVFLDADGDGRLDLLVTSDCFNIDCSAVASMFRLFRQTPAGAFEDVTLSSGLWQDGASYKHFWHRGGTTAGDIDNDGDPDLFFTMWRGGTKLFVNQGDGTFIDQSEASGAGTPPNLAVGPWQSVIHDFNQDGLPDIFVAVDFAEDQLLLQQPNQTFVDVARTAGIDIPWNGMGVALGDIENDGDFDIFVTNISDMFEEGPRHSTLAVADSTAGIPLFTESSQALGVDDIAWGWGVTFLDADNDRHLDLAATNGFPTSIDTSRFFFNAGASRPR